jgi:hypothetical protein
VDDVGTGVGEALMASGTLVGTGVLATDELDEVETAIGEAVTASGTLLGRMAIWGVADGVATMVSIG